MHVLSEVEGTRIIADLRGRRKKKNYTTKTNMDRIIKLFVLVFCTWLPVLYASTFYVSPTGTGDGSAEANPLGSISAGVAALSSGDTLVLLDGEYKQSLTINKSGTQGSPITIRAKNVGMAFINGEEARIPITILSQSYIHLDGLKAGNSNQYVYHILWCDHLTITRCSGFNAGGYSSDDANYHIFEIAYSDSVFAEDVWAWGTGRYSFVFYGCHGCHIRRGVFRPGFYRRCPHAGMTVYCTDNTLVENVIVFNARVDPASGYGGAEPWKLITGGFVCEGHDCPNNKSSGNNTILGCIGIDNGEHWNVTPRSQPAGCFVWNEYMGFFEDMVLWKNPDKPFADFTGTSRMPTRSLEGDPNDVVRNTSPQILKRYVDGTLTNEDLWPWPYEDIIKADMNMSQTITEYVREQLDPFIIIPDSPGSVRPPSRDLVRREQEIIKLNQMGPFISFSLDPSINGLPLRASVRDIHGRLIVDLAEQINGERLDLRWNTCKHPAGVYLAVIEFATTKYVRSIAFVR